MVGGYDGSKYGRGTKEMRRIVEKRRFTFKRTFAREFSRGLASSKREDEVTLADGSRP